MYQITKGMTDVETQLSSTIDTVLDGYLEARNLASQCLFKAKRFVIDLCTFMSQDYFKWKARGHNKQDAWNMTSLCVRRIFEEIHSERVVARDIYYVKPDTNPSAQITTLEKAVKSLNTRIDKLDPKGALDEQGNGQGKQKTGKDKRGTTKPE
jgi:hypothetical protein